MITSSLQYTTTFETVAFSVEWGVRLTLQVYLVPAYSFIRLFCRTRTEI